MIEDVSRRPPDNTDLPQSRGIHAAVAFVLGATCVPLVESSLVQRRSLRSRRRRPCYPLRELNSVIRIENVADVQTAIASAVEAVRDGTVEVVSAVSEPGDLVMVAVRSADSSIDPVAVCDGCDCLAALQADRVVFVQWDAAPRLFVANAFRHVNVIRTVIEDDALVGSPVAKVVVDNADLEDAFGQDGIHPRLAAMLTQTNIEIILPHEVTDG